MILNKIYNENCLETIKRIPEGAIDLILTDPPYPDYLAEEYQYFDGILDFLKNFNCRQIIFWSAKVPFPLDYTAVHIWDKKVPTTPYERIFERNGKTHYKLYSAHFINSTVAASFERDVFNEHPSQKPLKLIKQILLDNSKPGDTVYDPFIGSGTTALACKDLGRNYIGSEISAEYCEIAESRLAQGVLDLFTESVVEPVEGLEKEERHE